MYLSLFVEVLCLSFLSFALLCVHFSYAIILKRSRKLVALPIIVLQIYFYYKYSLALPQSLVTISHTSGYICMQNLIKIYYVVQEL